ncbi:MAG TPA: hypothetical protein VFQ39_10790 [Longimicrobium sp.]|nr:hypothetical protein [Longimicrobium sp.]
MRADTFARLVMLEAVVDAEVGWRLEHPAADAREFREGMIARVSDLVDQIDALDAVAAARVYDAVVDFLAELPDEGDDDATVEATLRFRRAVDRVVDRAMAPRDLEDPSTWAVVLDELLEETLSAYRASVDEGGVEPRGYLRCLLLLTRAQAAGERMLAGVRAERRPELRSALDRLAFAVRNRRPPSPEVERLAALPQRVARRHRPTNLSRIGAFIVGQLMRPRGRDPRPRTDSREERR